MTVTDFARIVGVSRQTIHRWIRDGTIETVRIGSRRRISLAKLRENHTTFYEHLQGAQCNDVERCVQQY
jgi:excisionase family DNA binding protein